MRRCDLVLDHATLPDGSDAAIGIAAGCIAAIEADAAALESVRPAVDLGGRLVIPGLVEGHAHLDKTFLGEAWKPHRPCSGDFDVGERVAIEKDLLAEAGPVEARARALLETAIAHGTTHMRSHFDIDAEVGLRNLEALLGVRERYRESISIQLVAFPQSGIFKSPGTLELMDEALKLGADLVGGLDPASFDGDVDGHLDAVFGLAERHGAGVDIHLHDPDTLGLFQLDAIAERTLALGMQGRVAVSHAWALGEVPPASLAPAAERLAKAGVAIMTNAPGSNAFPPVLPMRAAGVTVFAGSDNVRDAWWPYGDADMLERAMLIGYRSGFYTDEELAVAFDLVTASGAKVLGLADYGLEVGAPADLVVLDARSVPEAVVARPHRRDVYKAGRLVARDGVFSPT